MVIKPAAATVSVLRLVRSAAVNRWEMKVYEIIDARSTGRQLCETEGGSRKGLLIRRVRFEISVKHSLCQNPINRQSRLKVTVMLLFLEKRLDVSAFFFVIIQVRARREMQSFHSCLGFLMKHE